MLEDNDPKFEINLTTQILFNAAICQFSNKTLNIGCCVPSINAIYPLCDTLTVLEQQQFDSSWVLDSYITWQGVHQSWTTGHVTCDVDTLLAR